MNFKTSSLALAIFAAITSTSAMAEEVTKEKVDDVEVITVTGIRGSLVRSLFDKRNEDSVVDGISAEDIGKFPDQNVAESLQRITGVTIDRGDSGEGQKISIRGFGPNFNNVLFNGRTMPADNNQRGFSFDLIASELISGADVHKTLRADTLEGGLGGTVNVKTAKPLDFEGFKGAASAKGVYDTLAESTNPYMSALISKNFDDEFGVLASFAYQQRDSRLDKAAISSYASTQVYTGAVGSDTLTDEKHLRPRSAAQIIEKSDRERIGGTLIAQWQLADNMLLTGDLLYSQLSAKKDHKQVSNYYGNNPLYNTVFDEFGTVVEFDRPGYNAVAPGVIQNYVNGVKVPRGQYNSVSSNGRDRDSTTRMIGLNLDWDVSDNFNVAFDLQNSKASARSENNPLISFINPSAGPIHFKNTGDSFQWSSNEGFNGDTSNYKAGNIYLFTENRDDEVTEFRVDSEWTTEDYGYLTSVRAGTYYSDREKTVIGAQSGWANAAKTFGGFPMPSSLFSSTTTSFLSDHDQGGFVNSWLDFNPDDVFAYLNSTAASTNADHVGQQIMNDFENGRGTYATLAEAQAAADAAVAAKLDKIAGHIAGAPTEGGYGLYNTLPNAAKSWQVTEETLAAYVEANLEGESWSANLGLRYVTTDTASNAAGEEFVGTSAITAGTDILSLDKKSGDVVYTKGSYSKLLPSLNVKYDISDDLVARFSFSESLTRPRLEDLTAAQKISAASFSEDQGFIGTIKGKNTNLKPFTSTNIDLALEWYYAPESYVGGTYFQKDLSNWITDETRVVTLHDTIQNVDREFDQTSPFNAESAEVTGLELALLHNFDSGFGVQANYTILDTTGAANATSESKVNLHGLSESSYNIVGFYENGPLQVRIAYNWREGYTTCSYCVDTKGINAAKSIDDYGQIDASASYDLTEQISIFADVINLTDEDPYGYTVRKSNVMSIVDTGTRYSLGVRATF